MRYFLTFCILILGVQFGQKTSEDIQKEIDARSKSMKQLRQEIDAVEKRIKQKEREARTAEDILSEINQKIELTEKLIKSLTREERLINEKIEITRANIQKMTDDQARLKDQMKKRVIYLYQHGKPSLLETIFFSSNWNEMVYRVHYLNILEREEKRITAELQSSLEDLNAENERIRRELEEKQRLRKEKEQENENLAADLERRNRYIARIQKDKADLQEKLRRKHEEMKALEDLLTKLLQDKKAARAREEELARIRAMQNMATTGNFNSLKGKLIWPVEGKILSSFGTHRNTQLNTVTENPGIDIRAAQGTEVKSVLDGLVTHITYLRGFGNVIIIDHGGGYQTVYAHVENIRVHEKEYIQLGSVIGEVGDDGTDGGPKLHFEIYGNNTKLNPEEWLMKR